MIHAAHNIDPVLRDLDRYLQEEESHSVKQAHWQAEAESEFNRLNYLEIIAYQDDFDDLEVLFECVTSEKPKEARNALNSFIATVKEVFMENRIKELEQEEEKERQDDDYMERYYQQNGYPEWC